MLKMMKLTAMTAAMAVACLCPSVAHGRVAFVSPSQSRAKIVSPTYKTLSLERRSSFSPQRLPTTEQTTSTTSLQMGYQLPPSGPKGPLEEIKAILPVIGTAFLVGLFFASPLGGIFFAITNSLFVLALVTPFILFAGFQLWSALYTIEAPCPSCGQLPVRVLKNGEPSVCLNCGAMSRANAKGDGLELCNNPNDMMGGSGSLFDSIFGGMGDNGQSDFTADIIDTSTGPQKKSTGPKKKQAGDIIDVEVERD